MKNKWYPFLLGLLLMVFAAPAVHAALTGPVGPAIDPHGFPAFYQDGALQLEPCLPPPAGNAVLRPDMCVFDPLAGGALQVGGESFYWMADAQLPPLVPGGKALLVLALEAAFATAGPVDGQQMVFNRLRIRVDVPVVGTYTITHPFGQHVFNVTNLLDGINHTEDIGGVNLLAPDNAYAGALNGNNIGPFLTWPDYLNDNTLKAFDNGAVVEQYIGNPNIPHAVTGSPTGNNFFRIQGPAGSGIDIQTPLFTVMGKVFNGVLGTAHVFPVPPAPTLFAVGPVNREGDVGIATPLQPEGIRTGVDYPNFPVGFPLWYQDNAATSTPTAPVGGIKLGYCPGTDPKCISEPVNPNDPNSVALRAGGEGFWWSADAGITGAAGFEDARLVLAIEAFFNNDIILDGNQIGFARRRIRVAGLSSAGPYTITHPYGTEVFVAVDDGKGTGTFEINDTIDDMIVNTNLADLAATDNAFTGALFGKIGSRFLTWTTFNPDPVLNDPLLQRPLVPGDLTRMVMYVGDPAVPHAVTGSPDNTNIFRIVGPGVNAQTDLFSVSGMVFDPAFVAAGTTLPGIPAPVTEVITVTKARLRQRNLQLDLTGTSNSIGSVLTIHAGPDTGGPILGQVLVDAGGWRLRTVATTNLNSVSIVSSTGGTLLNQPVQVR